MKKIFGLPLVTAGNALKIAEQLGIRPWPVIEEAMSLSQYATRNLTEQERKDLQNFSPKGEALILRQPNGEPYTGIRHRGKPWATTFTILPGPGGVPYVPIAVEYKHGANKVLFVPPSGVISGQDEGSWEKAAKREFEEEAGIRLAMILPLADGGIPANGRKSTDEYHPFLGRPVLPIELIPTKLDKTEHLKTVVFTLSEWLKFLELYGEHTEECAGDITLRILLKFKMIAIFGHQHNVHEHDSCACDGECGGHD